MHRGLRCTECWEIRPHRRALDRSNGGRLLSVHDQRLHVGHFVHRHLPHQLVDTPGLLDRPLQDRNAIELQAIAQRLSISARRSCS